MDQRHRLTAGCVVAVVAFGAPACDAESAGTESGATISQLQEQVRDLERDLNAIDERMGALEDSGPAGDATDDALADSPAFLGRQVTLSGEVAEILDPSSFLLGGLDTDVEPVLVVGAQSPNDIVRGALAQVTGTVHLVEDGLFDRIETTPGPGFFEGLGVGNADEFVDAFRGELLLVAEAVNLIESEESVEGNVGGTGS